MASTGTTFDELFVAFLPADPAGEWRWRRIAGAVADDEQVWCMDEPAPWREGDTVVVAVPAALAPVQFVPMPAMPHAQALAAQRLALAGRGLGTEQHLALAASASGDRILSAMVAPAVMDGWIARCAASGIEPSALIPAALFLPDPGDGAVLAELAGEPLARIPTAAFAGEPALLEALAAGLPVREIDAPELGRAIADAALSPPLDLRQGRYAPRRVALLLMPDWRRLARMAAVAALLALVLMLVSILRLNRDSDAREEAVLAAAQARFPAATDLAAAERLVSGELARNGRGPAGFAPVAAAVLDTMRPLATVSLRDLAYGDDGTLRLTVAAPRPEDINAMLARLQQDGWAVTVPPALAPDPTGATIAAITVRAP